MTALHLRTTYLTDLFQRHWDRLTAAGITGDQRLSECVAAVAEAAVVEATSDDAVSRIEKRREAMRARIAERRAEQVTARATATGTTTAAMDVLVRFAALVGVSVEQLQSDDKCRHIAYPRFLAMWAMRYVAVPGLSASAIGRALGGRDHSTVLYGIRAAEEILEGDPELRERLRGLGGDVVGAGVVDVRRAA